jgi:hypothetical protein
VVEVDTGIGGSGDTKSNRRASMIHRTVCLCVEVLVSTHASSRHWVKSGRERCVNRREGGEALMACCVPDLQGRVLVMKSAPMVAR